MESRFVSLHACVQTVQLAVVSVVVVVCVYARVRAHMFASVCAYVCLGCQFARVRVRGEGTLCWCTLRTLLPPGVCDLLGLRLNWPGPWT